MLKKSIKRIFPYPKSIFKNIAREEARESGFNPRVIGSIKKGETSPSDTQKAAKEMAALKADLLLFSGGDGTARDIYDAVGEDMKRP